MKLELIIPDDLKFSDLKLAFDQNGASFDWTPIERICGRNGLDVALFKHGPEDNVAGLIWTWYAQHRAAGGDTDPVAEEYLAEVIAEDAAGMASVPPVKRSQ